MYCEQRGRVRVGQLRGSQTIQCISPCCYQLLISQNYLVVKTYFKHITEVSTSVMSSRNINFLFLTINQKDIEESNFSPLGTFLINVHITVSFPVNTALRRSLLHESHHSNKVFNISLITLTLMSSLNNILLIFILFITRDINNVPFLLFPGMYYGLVQTGWPVARS